MAKEFSFEKPVFQVRTGKLRTRANIMALIALFLCITKQVPTEIFLLGIKFNADDKETIVWFFIAITLALFFEFLCWAIPDIIKYVANFWAYHKLARWYLKGPVVDDVLAVSYTDLRNATIPDPPEESPRDPYNPPDSISQTEDNILWRANKWIILSCIIRIAIEVFIPIALNLGVLYCFWVMSVVGDVVN